MMKIKKFSLAVLCVGASVLMAACGTGTGKTDRLPASNGVEKTENVEIPNPWTECKNLEEAKTKVGFGLEAPEAIGQYTNRTIQNLDKEIIQVILFGIKSS